MASINHSELFTRWIRRADELEDGDIAEACRHLLDCPWRCRLSHEYAYRAGRLFARLAGDREARAALCASEPDLAAGLARSAEAITFLRARQLGMFLRLAPDALTPLLLGEFSQVRLRYPFLIGAAARLHGGNLPFDADREARALHTRHDCARCPGLLGEGDRRRPARDAEAAGAHAGS